MVDYARLHVEGISDLSRLKDLLNHHSATLKNGGKIVAPIYRVEEIRKKIKEKGYASKVYRLDDNTEINFDYVMGD